MNGPAWLVEALAGAEVAWCVLRDAPDAPAGGQDVDLLVAPTGLGSLTRALAARGFAPLPKPGRGTHRVYARYDAAEDHWPTLDVVTALAFGPHLEIRTRLAAGVLCRRTRSTAGVWAPAPGDGFWLLLLHALLDKGRLAPRHRDGLAVLAADATVTDVPARALDALALPAASPAALLGHARAGRWQQLEALVPTLRAALRHAHQPRSWLTAFRHRLLRRAGRDGWWPLRRGLVVGLAEAGSARTTALLDGLRQRLPVSTCVVTGGWARRRLAARGGRIALCTGHRAARGVDLLLTVDHATRLSEAVPPALATVWAAYARLHPP